MIISDVSSGNARQPLADLLETIKRRRTLIIAPLLAGVAIGVIGYLMAPLSYVSESVLVLDMRRVQALPNESAITPLPQDSPVLRSELDIISSRMMARKVIDILQADNVNVPTAFRSGTVLSAPPENAKQVREARDVDAAARERQRIDLLLSRLRVNNDGRSYTIFISYRAPDPVYAARVANAFVTAYLDHQIDVQQSAARRVSEWLGEKLVSLRSDLEGAERAAEDFRQKSRLAGDPGQISFQAQRVAALNTEIVAATGAVSLAEARLRTAESLKTNNEAPALTEVLASPAIQSLRNEQARVERQLDELRSNGALKSAEIPVLTAERDALKQQVTAQVDEIIKSLSNEIKIARQRRSGLEDALTAAEADLAQANQAQVQAVQLDREANASRTVYESYLTRYKQLIEQDGIAVPEAQMISAAEPATAKASPNLANWLLLGLGLGGLVSLLATVSREAFDKIRPAQTASFILPGIPAATLLPLTPQLTVPMLVNRGLDPASAFGRAIKSVHDRLRFLSRGRDSLSLAIISLGDSETKALLITALAQQFAASGVAVAVIDATNQHSRLSQALGLPETGQGTASTGRKLSGATLNHDHGSGIDIITPGQQVEGEWLSELIAQLRTDHKIILVDLPSVADDKRSVLLSRAADTALLVAQPDRNDQPANHALIQTMAALGRKPALAVVSQSTTSYRSWLESIIAFLRPNARQASQLFRAALKRRHQTASQSGHNQHEA
ncbi:GumC family protein [Brucella pseudogrignonensis]|uniref:G-rich domain on tyrosine kinase family protein n=1 Tax=Brucella pseudogrignonensis TaxID=419475 RepID=A0A256GAB5_9HYPH|nr:exopolysaccharide transport family protein [Brucella pseudogrignonensis]MQP42805.1 lipopolysaccharide biosynthesis protein [Ochrobactrum sp. MYb237]OYR24047.1 G-rich domain on tyrosine kinase family protein [Brucella pseudogrignonensis]PQZ39066.1 lipopolysaccharide biosynthesis protein [Brucella pseudogrignonensis]PRA35371.1 lipopolysaccharide biosynthesis protein [Brucella pseudogrignonensis]PRA61102.1 lipopolysaccharide biosynthesis protein [Brucella pseudogrignonensis]